MRNLIPLGSTSSNTAVFVVSKKSALNSLKDIKRGGRVIKVGTTGPGGGAYQRSMVLKLDGYPMKIITGVRLQRRKGPFRRPGRGRNDRRQL